MTLPNNLCDRMPDLLMEHHADRESLERRYSAPDSPTRWERFTDFFGEWLEILDDYRSDNLSPSDRVDQFLFQRYLQSELTAIAEEERRFAEIASLVPFADALIALDEARRRHQAIDSPAAAEMLNSALRQIVETEATLKARAGKGELPTPVQTYRAAGVVPAAARHAAPLVRVPRWLRPCL